MDDGSLTPPDRRYPSEHEWTKPEADHRSGWMAKVRCGAPS